MKATIFFTFLLAGTFSFYCNAKSLLLFGTKCISDSLPNNILIINSFDAMTMKARDKKKELFRELTDSLKFYLQRETEDREKVKVIIIPELFIETNSSDSIIFSMMLQNNSSGAIVIKKLKVFFNQTGVEVTKEEDGKKRVASYDICADITYKAYGRAPAPKTSEVHICEPFSTRSVASGLLAAGPDVVGKKKHTFTIVRQNAAIYLAQASFK
jgi:hypothetical protein